MFLQNKYVRKELKNTNIKIPIKGVALVTGSMSPTIVLKRTMARSRLTPVTASPRSPVAGWSPAPPWRRSEDTEQSGWKSSKESVFLFWWQRWCQDTALDNTHTQLHFGWLEHLEKKMKKYLPIYLFIPRFHWWKEKSLWTFVSAQEKGELFSILGFSN